MNKEQLEKSIIATLAYYDVLGLPLTSLEVYKYLIKIGTGPYFSNISDTLENSQTLKRYLDQKNGFYFLKGRDGIVKQRIRREKAIQEKWKKCKWAIKLLAGVPFIRMVALSGSMAVGNASKTSDIDLLIIVKIGRIWTTRLLVTILLSILGKRRYGRFIKDRICLNHYITDGSLKINFPSLYNAQTYIHLIPVLGDTDLFDCFQRENSWIKNWVLFYPDSENLKYLKPNPFLEAIAGLGKLVLWGKWGDFVEGTLAKCQKMMIKKSKSKRMQTRLCSASAGSQFCNQIIPNKSLRDYTGQKDLDKIGRGRVTTNDNQLEFHPDSPEAWIIDGYNKKMRDLGFSEMAKEKDSGLK